MRKKKVEKAPVSAPVRSASTLSREVRAVWGMVLLLLVMLFASYYPALRHPFVNYDDPDYVTSNPRVQQGLTVETVDWALTSLEQANWHPLTWISHALDYDLFGLNPAGHHFSSLLLHAVNSAILFLILWQATERKWRSFLVASLFALHPINVESVAWVAERKTVLSMFFFLLALASYGWYVKRPSVRRYLVVATFFVMALASKPMVVTLPFVLLLVDYWPLERVKRAGVASTMGRQVPQLSLQDLILEKLPLLVLSIASCVITILAQKPAEKTIAAIPFTARITNAIFSYCMYPWKAIWPLHLSVFYAHRGSTVALWQTALCLTFLTGVSAIVWRARTYPYLAIGWFWYLGTLVPMIGLVQVGEQGMADRYAYLPLVGLFVIVIWGLGDLGARHRTPPQLNAGLAVAVLLALSLLTRSQLRTWEGSFQLWSHSLEITKENYVAEDFIGTTLMEEAFQKNGESCADEASMHFQSAVLINPQDALGHLNLGYCQQTRGQLRGAEKEYQLALQSARSRYLKTRACLNLGAVYDALGDFEYSRRYFEQGLTFHPHDPEIQAGLAQLDADEKIADFVSSVSNHPSPSLYVQLGRRQQAAGHAQDARTSFQKALALDPKYSPAQEALNALDPSRR